jgi:hypothetical protein
LITRRRWRVLGGNPSVVNDIALWVVPAGIIGGRIYFDITTPADIPHVWYGVFAVWTGGLGIEGGVALAAVVGVWRLRRLGITAGPFANAIAAALLVAQAVGRLGNYFNKKLLGRPTTLPWGLEIPYTYRVSGGIPAQDLHFATFLGVLPWPAAEHVHRDPRDAGRPAVVRVRAASARPACRHTPRHRQPGTGHSAGLRGATRARSEELEEMERRAVSLSARVPSTAPVTPHEPDCRQPGGTPTGRRAADVADTHRGRSTADAPGLDLRYGRADRHP